MWRNQFLFSLVLLGHLYWIPTVGNAQIQNGDSQRPICELAEEEKWDQVRIRLTGENVNQASADGMTVLHWAAFQGKSEVVATLLKSKANPNLSTIYGVTPLSIAAERGYHQIVSALIKADASIEKRRLGRETPLMLAARNGDPHTVKALLEAGAKVDESEIKGQTALMWAAAAGNSQATDLLIKAGANIKTTLNKSGYSALSFAARNGHQDVVIRLLQAGCDVNRSIQPARSGGRNPRKGMSALMLAIESGHLKLALKLVELGADPNDQRSGYAPLHAISWVRRAKLGDDPDGDPPPRITGKVNFEEFVRQMVKAGADVNLRLKKGSGGAVKLNPKGATPFLFAAATADLPLMKLLVKLGADPGLTNADGSTAIMAAAGIGVRAVGEYPGSEKEVCKAIRYLVEQNVDLNAVDKNGETAMHGVAYRNYPAAVQLLSELGAGFKDLESKKQTWMDSPNDCSRQEAGKLQTVSGDHSGD